MDGFPLRDEAREDRIRLAEEFLDPSKIDAIQCKRLTDDLSLKPTLVVEGIILDSDMWPSIDHNAATAPTLFLCSTVD